MCGDFLLFIPFCELNQNKHSLTHNFPLLTSVIWLLASYVNDLLKELFSLHFLGS